MGWEGLQMAGFFKKSDKKANISDFNEPTVKVAKGTYRKVVAVRFIKVISSVFVILLAVYGVFAVTLLRVVPTTTVGFVPVKNMTFEGGIAPADAQLLISVNTPQGTGFVDRLKQSFLPTDDAALVQVVAGPYGKMAWVEPDILTVDGYPTGLHLEAKEGDISPLESRSEYLKDEYLALCLEGSCEVGDAIIFPKDRIMGTPLTRADVDKVLEGEE